jgi:hypothetical protein
MLSRIILAAFFVGFVFATGEADARSAGHGGSRGGPAPRSLQRFHQAPVAKGTTHGLHVTPHHHRRSFHHHHGFRQRWPYVFAAPYILGDDGVLPPAAAYDESASVPPGLPVVMNRRRCFVEPHIVPSEVTGGMRTVTVTRCY